MLKEIVLGEEPTLRSPEADALRAQLTKEVEAIKAKGGSVEITKEWV